MESPADDSNARESSVPVALDPGYSALLLTPSRRRDADARYIEAVVPTDPCSVRALTVSVTDSVDTVLDRWRAHADHLPVETAVVTVGDGARSAAVGSGVGEMERFTTDVVTTSVSDAGDLTGLGIAVSSCLDAWADVDEDVVVCVDSLSPLLQLVETQRLFLFLHILTTRLRAADARGYFHLDPDAHDARTLTTITSLFSVTYELGGDGSWHQG